MKKEKYLVRKISSWGERNYREFIWRKENNNSFIVFVSEFLLRKTQAKSVEKFLKTFLVEFKTFNDLDKIHIDDLKIVLKQLGLYNQRAHALKKISKIICLRKIYKLDGETISTFPYCGRYIANAYDCFFNKLKKPLVDNNIQRLFFRYFSLKKCVEIHKADYLWDFSYSLLPDKNYVLFNYCLLDFAAIICKPKQPLCKNCPIALKCDYFKGGNYHV